MIPTYYESMRYMNRCAFMKARKQAKFGAKSEVTDAERSYEALCKSHFLKQSSESMYLKQKLHDFGSKVQTSKVTNL